MVSVLVNASYSLYCNLDLYTLIWSAIGVNDSCFLPSGCVHKISHFLLIPLVADSFLGVAGPVQNFQIGKLVYFCEWNHEFLKIQLTQLHCIVVSKVYLLNKRAGFPSKVLLWYISILTCLETSFSFKILFTSVLSTWICCWHWFYNRGPWVSRSNWIETTRFC